MPTVFTRILNGELPGRMVWLDGTCGAFLSINPLQTGHTLVVPRAEVDHWIDLDDDTMAHLWHVSKVIGAAQQRVFRPVRVGVIVAGFEVPHVHVHVLPATSEADFDFARAARNPDPAVMDDAAERLRAELRRVAPGSVPG